MDKQVESFYHVDYSDIKIPVIAIYKDAKDYPNCYIARLWDINKPTNVVMVSKDIENIRQNIPSNMCRLSRTEQDVKCLVETWI